MKFLLVCFSLIMPLSTCFATHILSGNIGYRCLTNELYEITIELERDCSGAGAPFDREINVAIYSEGNLIENIEVEHGEILEVEPKDYEDCMTDQFQLCRQKTYYIFQVSLPVINKAYTISYQRCCWSAIIGNIDKPDAKGITITTDITPLAQSLCNTQEISTAPISILACPGTNVSIELPEFDNEGDSLVYDVCLPYAGGGIVGGPAVSSGCDGLIPVPACPPPYEELSYAAGFDDENPFPTVDGFKFENGVLQFKPSTLGFYLAGLCVSEYRNGQILSSRNLPLAVVTSFENSNTTQDGILNSWRLSHLTSNRLQIASASNDELASFELLNVSGRHMILPQTFRGQDLNIDIGQLTTGIYFLKIQVGNQLQVIRFYKP